MTQQDIELRIKLASCLYWELYPDGKYYDVSEGRLQDMDDLVALIHQSNIEARLDELSRYGYPRELTLVGTDSFWERTNELKQLANASQEDTIA